MKSIPWRWLLPSVQLALALACHILDTHVYRTGVYRDRVVNNTVYFAQHSPAWLVRLSNGMNFPALVLAYPLRNEVNPIYERNSVYTLIWISPHYVGFFVSIFLLWYWIGRSLENRQTAHRRWPRNARLAALAGGIAFCVLTATYANQMIATEFTPERQIGVFGIAWASVLLTCFLWQIMREFGGGAPRQRLFVVAIIVSITACAWLGGPWGTMQALGEYLRPDSVRMLPLNGQCTTSKTVPANLAQTVEAQGRPHHLSPQEFMVCHSMFRIPQGDPRFTAVLGGSNLEKWLPVTPGDRLYQFRRHFALVVADDGGEVIVEAAFIQSRWEYLLCNWNKTRSSWSWPYEGLQEAN